MQRLSYDKAKQGMLGFIFFLSLTILFQQGSISSAEPAEPGQETPSRVERVIVQLDLPYKAEPTLENRAAVNQQRAAIRLAQQDLILRLTPLGYVETTAAFETIPYIAIEIEQNLLTILESDAMVLSIEPDEAVPPLLDSVLPVVGAPIVHEAGITGAGQTVAVLDTGVDIEHTAFTTGGSRIVEEACFSSDSISLGGSYSVCPNGSDESYETGAGDDCVDEALEVGVSGATSDCKHGTHVAGIIAANDGSLTGMAPDVQLIAVQVFSAFEDYGRMLSFTSDQIQGLEFVYSLREQYDIASINMSLGAGNYSSACDADARGSIIRNLEEAGIATVIAAGNEGNKTGIGAPACVSAAVSVGASEDDDDIASFSNISSELDLLAPGSSINSSVPGGEAVYSGTSMAAPMVAGAFALLNSVDPNGAVAEHVAIFQSTGVLLDDNRPGGNVTGLRRIDVSAAVEGLSNGITLELSAPVESYAQDEIKIVASISNNSIDAVTDLTLSHSIPTGTTLVAQSASNGGTLLGETLAWSAISLAPFETITRSWRLNPLYDQSLTISASLDSSALSQPIEASTSTTILAAPVCNYFDGFDGGLLQSEWETSTVLEGQVSVINSRFVGSEHSLLLDDKNLDGGQGLAAVILPVDLSAEGAVWLDFWWQGAASPTNGLAVSWDLGEDWVPLLTPGDAAAFERIRLDLSTLEPDNEQWTSADPLMIRFVYQGDGPFDPEDEVSPIRGLIIDEVQINCGGDLVWDGEGDSGDWSNPRNWNPDLEPYGNSVSFNGTSIESAQVDNGFIGHVGDLLIDVGYTGLISQTAPLSVQGAYTQTSGSLTVSQAHPLTVDGSFLFQDGSLQQTATVSGTFITLLRLTDSLSTTVVYDGVVVGNELKNFGKVTVTVSGPSYADTVCDGFSDIEISGLARCVDVQTEIEEGPTFRLYLNEDELAMAQSSGTSPISSDTILPPAEDGVLLPDFSDLSILQYRNGLWTPLDGFATGEDSTGIYVEGELEVLEPIATIGAVEVPTAVTLSFFGLATNLPQIDTLATWIIFFILLAATGLHFGWASSIIRRYGR